MTIGKSEFTLMRARVVNQCRVLASFENVFDKENVFSCLFERVMFSEFSLSGSKHEQCSFDLRDVIEHLILYFQNDDSLIRANYDEIRVLAFAAKTQCQFIPSYVARRQLLP